MISVDPEALTFEVDWNGQDSDIISVSNVAECADNLDFSVHITYLDEELAAMQQFRDRILHNAARIPASLEEENIPVHSLLIWMPFLFNRHRPDTRNWMIPIS